MKDNEIVYEEMDVEKEEEIMNTKDAQKSSKKTISKAFFIAVFAFFIIGGAVYVLNSKGIDNPLKIFVGDGVKNQIPIAKIKLEARDTKKIYENLHPIGKLQSFLQAKYVKPIDIIDLKQNPKYEPTLQITFDLGDSGLMYNIGDTVGIFPKNEKNKVEQFATSQGYDLEKVITYDEKNKEEVQVPYPNGVTIRYALTEIIDLSCHIDDKIIKSLVQFVKDEREVKEIEKIFIDDREIKGFNGNGFNLVDITKIFKSIRIPFEELHNYIPFIKPRTYTISSSPNVMQNKFKIVATLVSRRGYEYHEVFGLSSGYLKRMKETKNYEDTKIIINKGPFVLPEKPNTPIMMICIGSGIAPFMSFLEELNFRGVASNETYLIYGAKSRESDFIYEKELMEYKSKGVLTDVITAFSRDQNYKIYVQDRFKEHFEKRLDELINKKHMVVYVSGPHILRGKISNALIDTLGPYNFIKLFDTKQFIAEFWEDE